MYNVFKSNHEVENTYYVNEFLDIPLQMTHNTLTLPGEIHYVLYTLKNKEAPNTS